MTVVLNSVTTGDAAPTTAPHKISNVSGHDTAVPDFTVSGTTPCQSYRLKSGGTTRLNGTNVGQLGAVCGMDVCHTSTLPMAATTPVTFTPTITYASLGADGTKTINLYVLRNGTWE